MNKQLTMPEQVKQAEIVMGWGFSEFSEEVLKRESNIATELWSPIKPERILILDKSTNLVTDYKIDWSLFI